MSVGMEDMDHVDRHDRPRGARDRLRAVGWFLLKAAYEFDAKEAVGLDGALTKILRAATGRGSSARRRGSDRLRRLLDLRGSVPQDLSSTSLGIEAHRCEIGDRHQGRVGVKRAGRFSRPRTRVHGGPVDDHLRT